VLPSGRWLAALGVASLIALPGLAAARRDQDKDRKVSMRVALQVGGVRYDAVDTGVCLHVVGGGIYEQPAEQYSMRHNAPGRRLNLTVWRLTSGGDMFTLRVSNGTVDVSIDTVRAGKKLTTSGSGTVSVQAGSKGGTFTISAADAHGVRVSGTVSCDEFTAPVEDNG
jgi:hypothetical protein